jgi:hypothetical protein
MKYRSSLLAKALVFPLAAMSASIASAQDDVPTLEEMWRIIQQQEAKIDALRKENEELKRAVTAVPKTPVGDAEQRELSSVDIAAEAGDPSVSEVSAASDPLNETTLDLYGHAMLDMGYQVNQSDPNWFDVVRPTKLPSVENEYGDDGNFYSGVRQSRLGVKSNTPTRFGDLKTWWEFELFGVGADAGQTTFRLRHAWGELGSVGAGQTDSVFMDMSVFPNSIEYWGPNAMVLFRNVQLRWTPWSQDNGSRFAVSLERPGASGDRGQLSDRIELDGIEGDYELPDLAAHFRHVDDWGHVQLAGILRQIEWVDLNDDAIDLSGDELGWGLNLSTNINLGRHVFRGSVVYGEGIQNYMNDGSADIGISFQPDDATLPIRGTSIPLLGVVAFLDLNWSDTWTSTIGYSIQDNDLPDLSAPSSFERGQYALANVLYHPTRNVFMGPEIQWAKRDNFGPFSADDFRIQFSAKYSFGKVFGQQ